MNSKQLDYLGRKYINGAGIITTSCPLCQPQHELVTWKGYRLTINTWTGWVECSWDCNAGHIKQWFRTATPPEPHKCSPQDDW